MIVDMDYDSHNQMLSVLQRGIRENMILNLDDYRNNLKFSDAKRKVMSTIHRTVKNLTKKLNKL